MKLRMSWSALAKLVANIVVTSNINIDSVIKHKHLGPSNVVIHRPSVKEVYNLHNGCPPVTSIEDEEYDGQDDAAEHHQWHVHVLVLRPVCLPECSAIDRQSAWLLMPGRSLLINVNCDRGLCVKCHYQQSERHSAKEFSYQFLAFSDQTSWSVMGLTSGSPTGLMWIVRFPEAPRLLTGVLSSTVFPVTWKHRQIFF